MFSKGELVAYPEEGAGRIVEIRNGSFFFFVILVSLAF